MNLFDFTKKVFSTFLLSMLCVVAFAQGKTVAGVVLDEFGDPMIGVNVAVKGTTNGAVTDFDGNYVLHNVKSSDVLAFTFIGYVTKEETVGDRAKIDLTMTEDNTALEEVVVVGYGTMKKKDLTGSVATVSAEALTAVPVASATEALTGKMAGVQITTTEGSPDAEMKIRVRGGGSITQSNDPLFIVDGFPVESISDIPASDIEDMTVLKDASSTAIYGSRGANGVILVTTKSGKEGKFKVSYNAYYSWKKIAKTLDVLSPSDYAKWQYEYAMLKDKVSNYEKFFGTYNDLDLYDGMAGNDWQDLTFGRVGNTFNHNLGVTGGTEKIKFNFNYAHMNDKAIMEGSSYRRDNLSLKVNSEPTKNTKLDFTVRYSKTYIRGGGANDATSSYDSDKRLKYSVIYTPIPLENLDSSAGSDDDDLGNLYNPLEAISDNDREQRRQNLNLGGAFTWEIIKNLRAKTEVGYDVYNNVDHRFWGTTTYYVKNVPSADNQNLPAAQFSDTSRRKIRSTNTLSYNFKNILPKSQSLDLLLGHEYIFMKSTTSTNIVHGYPEAFTAKQAWALSTMGTPYQIKEYINPDDKMLSFFGRANYQLFDSRYLLTATVRADASSKFSDENRWGVFPSAAIAWRFSSESFMENTKDWLDDAKLRFSYGTAGNNNIPSGQLSQEYQNSTTSWINGYSNYWAPSKTMANPDLTWETTITRNVGLDLTFLGGRLTSTFEAYWNNTKDLLINFNTSGTGYDTQYRNMGETKNKGFEATVNWTILDNKDWTVSLSANVGFNDNEIVSLGMMDDFGESSNWASTEILDDYWIAVGGRVGQIRGYVSDGRYEVSDFEGYVDNKWVLKDGVADVSSVVGSPRPGTMKLKDLDGDGQVTTDDQQIIGDVNPKATGGFTLNARYKWFDVAANFNYSIGNEVYNANKIEFTSTGKYQYRNLLTTMADGKRWTNLKADGTISNDPDELAQMNATTTMWSPLTDRMILSDWAVEDGSFLRLNTLTVGYTMPKALLKKVKIENLRFYVTGYNLFCLTNYSGYDPEVSSIRKTELTPGVDYSAYPKSRQFTIGLNLNF